MATYSRVLLSGSTNGKPIPVVAVATLGTLIHAPAAGLAGSDEVYLWASNVTNAAVTLTIEWGAAGVGSQLINTYSIPAYSSPIPIATGQSINNGLLITAFASVANAINISGNANRIA